MSEQNILDKPLDELRAMFSKLADENYKKECEKSEAFLEKLTKLVEKLKQVGADVSLSPLSIREKTRLGMSTNDQKKLQLVLHIYERQYLIFPLGENEFYFYNHVINKEFPGSNLPRPSASKTDDGTVFSFDNPDAMESFFSSVLATAAHDAAFQKLYGKFDLTEEDNTPQLQRVKKDRTQKVAKGLING